MRNKKAIIGALIAPALALTGGVAYASTASGSPATVTRPAVTATVGPHSQQAGGQARHDRCDNWGRGDDRCDWRGHGYQRQPTRHQATQHRSGQAGDRRHQGYQGSGQYGGYGDQGSRGYGGHGWDNRSGGCGDCGDGW